MLIVCRSDLAADDLERLGAHLRSLPYEIRWARRGGRLVILVERAVVGAEDVKELTQDPAVAYALRDPSPREIGRLFSRRDVLNLSLAGTGILAAAAVLAPLGGYLASPAGRRAPGGDYFVAHEDQIPVKSAQSRVIDGTEFLIVRRDESHYYALASTCTHSHACHVTWDPTREQLICPCHRGIFDLQGNVVAGPPPRPLEAREVVVRDGNVLVQRKAR